MTARKRLGDITWRTLTNLLSLGIGGIVFTWAKELHGPARSLGMPPVATAIVMGVVMFLTAAVAYALGRSGMRTGPIWRRSLAVLLGAVCFGDYSTSMVIPNWWANLEAVADSASGKYGYRKRGSDRWLVAPQFDKALSIPEHTYSALVVSHAKAGCLSRFGYYAIPPDFDALTQCPDSLPTLLLPNRDNFRALAKTGGKFHLIDQRGHQVGPLFFDDAEHTLPVFRHATRLLSVSMNGKWGYVNDRGALAIPSVFDEAHSFSDRFAVVRSGTLSGVIDGSGKYMVKPNFDAVEVLSDGDGLIKVGSGGRVGLVSTDGSILVSPVWDEVLSTAVTIPHTGPSFAHAVWVRRDMRFGLVTTWNQVVIPPVLEGIPSGILSELILKDGKWFVHDTSTGLKYNIVGHDNLRFCPAPHDQGGTGGRLWWEECSVATSSR